MITKILQNDWVVFGLKFLLLAVFLAILTLILAYFLTPIFAELGKVWELLMQILENAAEK